MVGRTNVKNTSGGVNVLRVSDEFREYDLPVILQSGTLYSLRSSDGNTIITSTVADTGVWLFDNGTKTFTQIYTLDNGWTTFQRSGDGDIILIGSGKPILLYNSATKTITHLYSTLAAAGLFKVLSNGDILFGGAGVLLYDKNTKTITRKYTSGTEWSVFLELSDGNCVITGGNGCTGVLFYNATTKSVTQKYSSNTYLTYSSKLHNDDCIIAGLSGGGLSGILIYRNDTQSVTKASNVSGYEWGRVTKLADNNYLIGNYATGASDGLCFYDTDSHTLTKVYNTGYQWCNHHPLPNGDCIIASSSGMITGLLLFKSSNKTVKQIYSGGNYWRKSYLLPNGNVIIYDGTNNTLKYNTANESIEVAIEKSLSYSYKASDSKLLFSAINIGIYEYDLTTELFKELKSTGTYTVFNKLSNYILISMNVSPYGFVLYDGLTGNLELTADGYAVSYITDLGNKRYLTSSGVSANSKVSEIDINSLTVRDIPLSTYGLLNFYKSFIIPAQDKVLAVDKEYKQLYIPGGVFKNNCVYCTSVITNLNEMSVFPLKGVYAPNNMTALASNGYVISSDYKLCCKN